MSTGHPTLNAVEDGGALDDICPICDEVILDDDEWTKLPNGYIAHVECAEDLKPAHD